MPVDSISSPSLTGTRRIMDAFAQGSATGRIPSRRYLDQLIQAELDAAANNMARNRQQAEQVRQFDIGQQNATDTAEANRAASSKASMANLATTAGALYLMSPAKAAAAGAAPGTIGTATGLSASGMAEAGATYGQMSAYGYNPLQIGAAKVGAGIDSAIGALTAPSATAPVGVAGPTTLAAGAAPAVETGVVGLAGNAALPAALEAGAGPYGGGVAIGSVSEAGALAATEAGAGGYASMAAPFMWPAAAGFAAPKLLDALHKDSTENLGHNLSLGLIRNEKSARMVGSTATGFAAGAATGAAIGAVGGPIGALVGGVVGAVAGFFSSLF